VFTVFRDTECSQSAAIISPEDYNDTAASVEEVHASGLDASTKKPKQKKESMVICLSLYLECAMLTLSPANFEISV
jgi:hypothetical protein